MAEEKEKVKEADSAAKGAKKGSKLLLLVGIFGLLIVVAVGAVVFLAPSLLPIKGKKGEESSLEKGSGSPSQGHLYSLESMIVNLADTDFPRYLKVKIDLESDSSKPQEEFEKRLPQLKDLLLSILTSKTYAEIADASGKMRLKEEILQQANQVFSTLKIKTVYFTEFVVQ
ncbi:MAG: flagellar basal body-associated FliL family protein [Desulfobacterota bacterium]|nr:flagellar basal body-associated FliL family protein [Thermodesulfobacteriota bacterium]